MSKMLPLICLSLSLVATLAYVPTRAITTFTPTEKFTIPAYNSAINFASNGSYNYAFITETNESDLNLTYWVFVILDVGTGKTNGLAISAKNCNVTITNITSTETTDGYDRSWLYYTVAGRGNQYVLVGEEFSELNVYVDGAFKDQGDGWTLANGWLAVTSSVSNVSIYSSMRVPTLESNSGNTSSESPLRVLYEATLAIVTGVAVITIILTLTIHFRRKSRYISTH